MMSFKISILCVSDHDCLIALLADITKFMLLIKPKSLGHFYMEDRSTRVYIKEYMTNGSDNNDN